MQRIIGIIAGILIPLSSLPLAAAAAEHGRPTNRPAAVRAESAHAVERPVMRAYAPRPVIRERYAAPRPVIRERYAAPRPVVREHVYAPRPVVRERMYAPRPVVHERIYAPRSVERERYAPRPVVRREFVPRAQIRQVRRNSFVRYYSPNRFVYRATPRRVVFHRYIPRRIFVAPPVRIVRTYVPERVYYGRAELPASYVYRGYMPVYGSTPTVTSVYYGYNGYNTYNGYNPYNGYNTYSAYPYYQQYASYPAQYTYGFNQPYGVNPFGNAQLQGVVLSDTNGGILLLTPSLQPLFVNTAVAQQNGYVQGNISPGSFVNVFGYNAGNEFIATALN